MRKSEPGKRTRRAPGRGVSKTLHSGQIRVWEIKRKIKKWGAKPRERTGTEDEGKTKALGKKRTPFLSLNETAVLNETRGPLESSLPENQQRKVPAETGGKGENEARSCTHSQPRWGPGMDHG